jgi:hypothetical protein
MIKNGLLKVFAPKGEEFTGAWSSLHSERFTISTLSLHIVDDAIKDDELGGICNIPGRGKMKCIQILILKRERTGPLGRPRCMWEVHTVLPNSFAWLATWH